MKFIRLFALLLCVIIFITACGDKVAAPNSDEPYGYDLTPYFKLGQYKGIEIYKQEAVFVTTEEIDYEIDSFLYTMTTTEEVSEGTVKDGDTVNIDFIGRINGVAFEGGTAAGFNLTIGSGSFIPGFEESLIDCNIGETVFIDVTFPEDYFNEEFAGKASVFEVTLNYLLIMTQPELTDDLVKANVPDCTTVAQYKKLIEDEIRAYKEEQQSNYLKSTLWETAKNNSTLIKCPEFEVERYYSEFIAQYTQLAAQNSMTLEQFLSSNYGVTTQVFSTDMRGYAEEYVHDDLFMYSIMKAENITFTDADYTEELEKYFDMYNYGYFLTKEEFEEYYSKDELKKAMLQDKVINFLIANAIET